MTNTKPEKGKSHNVNAGKVVSDNLSVLKTNQFLWQVSVDFFKKNPPKKRRVSSTKSEMTGIRSRGDNRNTKGDIKLR